MNFLEGRTCKGPVGGEHASPMQAGLDVGDSDQARSCAQIVCGTQYTKLTHVSVQEPTHFTNLYPEQGCSLALCYRVLSRALP